MSGTIVVTKSDATLTVEATELITVLETRVHLIVNPDDWISPSVPVVVGYWTLEDGVTNWTLEDGVTPWETE